MFECHDRRFCSEERLVKETRQNVVTGPKIVVVGSGLVGATTAYTLTMRGLASEIVLIDVRKEKAEGDAMDIQHGLPFTESVKIRAGDDYSDCEDADIIVIAAGVNQRPGESRLDLLKKNTEIFHQIVGSVVKYNTGGIFLIATNPVDVLTYATLKFSGFPPSRVIGSGTLLDTARLRYLLGEYLKVDPRSIHAYIIGEHGDTEIPVWSLANVAGIRLMDFCPICGREQRLSRDVFDQIFDEVKNAAYRIIERKGATYYAIALALCRIVESIVRDQHSVLTVSTLVEDYYGVGDICIGVPCVVNGTGIESIVTLPLNDEEAGGFRKSAEALKQAARSVGL